MQQLIQDRFQSEIARKSIHLNAFDHHQRPMIIINRFIEVFNFRLHSEDYYWSRTLRSSISEGILTYSKIFFWINSSCRVVVPKFSTLVSKMCSIEIYVLKRIAEIPFE